MIHVHDRNHLRPRTIRIAESLVWVKAYTRRDGNRIAGYARKRARRKSELLILI